MMFDKDTLELIERYAPYALLVLLLLATTRFQRKLGLLALRSLEVHFLRSLLATLGVMIGVGSVVACMSILEGATGKIMNNFRSLGSNLIFIQPSMARIEGRPIGRAQTLEMQDLDTLVRELPKDVVGVAPQAMGAALVKYFRKADTFTVMATSEAYFEMNGYSPAQGRIFSKQEAEDEQALVAVLGSKVAEKLFGGMNPVGQPIKVRNVAYRVIGVMEARGNVGFLNADEMVHIPIKSGLKRFFNRKWLDWVTVQAAEGADLAQLKKQLEGVLRRAHNIRPGQEDDFEVDTLEEAVRNFSQAAMIFKVVFYSIAGISLLVGGIGIMNIMLVSVTERTREIGVRMAVGARRVDILWQFLVEALIISLLGGGLGLLLGAMFADLLHKILEGMFETVISAKVVMVALGTTTVVGVISGIYPAIKASALDPVEALRYE